MVLAGIVVTASVASCSNEGAVERMDGIPVVRGSTQPAGTPLGDGFEVAEGTVLVGEVFPSSRAGLSSDTIDDGWRALLLVTGDLEQVLNAYTTQARAIGLFPHPRCVETPDGVLACTGFADETNHAIEIWLQRGRAEEAGSPVSHVFLRYRRTGPEPAGRDAVPAEDSHDVSAPWDVVPDGWPELPKPGERYEHSLAVPEHTELLAHPAQPWSAWGSVAVFEVTGDPRPVVESLVGGRGRAGRPAVRESHGARTTSGYTINPSPAGTVWAQAVERDGRPTYLMVEHDPTD
jgi:hypothetical protein